MIKRREFVAGLGSTAAWPVVARAQQPEGMRRIGVLMFFAAGDVAGSARVEAFREGLQRAGWIEGRNVQIDLRSAADPGAARKHAAELVALKPNAILATANALVGPLQDASRTVPIVFVTTTDPVGSGFVASLARPGGNATGFLSFEFSTAAKWLELLKEIAPAVTHVAVVRDPTVPA